MLVSIYAGEISSPELRGVLGAICQLSVILGKIYSDIAARVENSCIVMVEIILNLDLFVNLKIISISI